MVDLAAITEHMPVVDSQNRQFALVDHLDAGGKVLKLTRDAQGRHHWIPVSWVTRVDHAVHVDRPCQVVLHQWMEDVAG